MATINQIPAVLYFFVPAYLANMSPVLVQPWFTLLATPIDAGCMFRGRRILGDHKTWRGLLAGIVVAPLILELQILAHQGGYMRNVALFDYGTCSLWLGVLMGLGAGVGDAVKSFFKRQIGIAPGASWIGFDQLDFFVGSYVFASVVFAPPLAATLACTPLVFLGSIAVTATAACFGMKDSWL